MGAKTAKLDTAQQILDVAQSLVQTRGYNSFSYADVASALKMTKASLHYHFPSKADLGYSLIARYEDRFRHALVAIDAADGSSTDRIRAFIKIYADVLADHRMCLCGMLAAEFETLPKAMQAALDHYFEMSEMWLEDVLTAGRLAGDLRFDEPEREVARFVIATLEGGMLLARSHGSQARFDSTANRLLAGLTGTPTKRGSA